MAKRRRNQKRRFQTKRTHSTRQEPRAEDLVKQAEQQMRSGRADWAVKSAQRALEFARTESESEAARAILAEGELRLAMDTKIMDERLDHIEQALQFAPEDPRPRFHRAITCWRLGDLEAAVADFDYVAASPIRPQEDGRDQLPNMAYLRQLTRFATGQSWDAENLLPAQINTLRLMQALVDGRSATQVQELVDGVNNGRSDQTLAGDPALWQMVVAMQNDAGSTEPVSFLNRLKDADKHTPLAAILHYFQGLSAMRHDKLQEAKARWLHARQAGLQSSQLALNLNSLLREEIILLAEEGRWQEVVRQAEKHPAPDDTIWSETVSLACFHLGYQEAQSGNWQGAAHYWRTGSQYESSRHLSQNLALAEETLEHWEAAAEAWRDMIRRRPRKTDHPDYLDDQQVAAIWEHAADCYTYVEMGAEATTCLQNALKYSPENLEIRLKLADVYIGEERSDAAINELNRILERDENHLPALTRLGALYEEGWRYRYSARSIWRRILAIDPNHTEARQALGDGYIQEAEWSLQFGQPKRAIQILEEGLAEVPASPSILLMLGVSYRKAEQDRKARDYLLQAYHAAPQVAATVGPAIHELLHVDGEDVVESLLPQIRQMTGLQPPFWVNQGRRVLECELDRAWALRFFDEALTLAEQPTVDDTKAGVLIEIYETVASDDDDSLVEQYEQRIRTEVPDSGAVEYIEAFEKSRRRDAKGSRRLLRKAKRQAKRVNDSGVLRRAEAIETALSSGLAGLLGRAGELGILEKLLGEMEDMDDFPDFF